MRIPLDLDKLTTGKHLTELEENILTYIIDNISIVQDMGVRAVAKETYSSPASIIRLSKKMGYSGFTDMYYSLLPLVKKEEFKSYSSENTILDYELTSIARILTEEQMDQFNSKIFIKSSKYIFIYATGFSKIISEYIYKKLLILGKKAIFASGSDSVGIFENNLDDIGAILIVSKSGETSQVYNKLKKATEADIFSISFTQSSNNRIAQLSDLNISIQDTHPLDDRNMLPNTFFPAVLLSFEFLLERYLEQF